LPFCASGAATLRRVAPSFPFFPHCPLPRGSACSFYLIFSVFNLTLRFCLPFLLSVCVSVAVSTTTQSVCGSVSPPSIYLSISLSLSLFLSIRKCVFGSVLSARCPHPAKKKKKKNSPYILTIVKRLCVCVCVWVCLCVQPPKEYIHGHRSGYEDEILASGSPSLQYGFVPEFVWEVPIQLALPIPNWR
jgi:hypothetical protein